MFPLPEKEKKIRSIFLGLLILEILINSLQADRSKWMHSVPFIIGVLSASSIFLGIQFWILYQCALKNPGTKWLMFCKVLRYMGLGFYIISLLYLGGILIGGIKVFDSLKGIDPNSKLTLGIGMIFPFLSAILNVIIIRYISKMRTINTNAQVRYLTIQDPSLFEMWDNSASLNELAMLFRAAVEKFPRCERGLIQEYNKRKIKFSV